MADILYLNQIPVEFILVEIKIVSINVCVLADYFYWRISFSYVWMYVLKWAYKPRVHVRIIAYIQCKMYNVCLYYKSVYYDYNYICIRSAHYSIVLYTMYSTTAN